MSTTTAAPALNMKVLLKAIGQRTLGRIPVVGLVSRKAWRGLRKVKHRVRHGSPGAAQQLREVADLSRATHALLAEVRDGAFDRLDNGLREQWKVKDAIFAAIAETAQAAAQTAKATGEVLAETNRGVQAGLAAQAHQLHQFHLANAEQRNHFRDAQADRRDLLQKALVEHRAALEAGLKPLANKLEDVDGQILQLHDHHASCYLRLAAAADDTAAAARQLADDRLHANAQWLEKLTASTESNAQWLEKLTASTGSNARWLEQVAAGVQGNSNWLEKLTETHRGQGHWLERLAEELRAHSQGLEHLAAGNHANAQWLDTLTAGQAGTNQWLETVAATLKGNGEWLDLLSRKVMTAAMDIRERIPAVPETGAYPPPVVPDPDALERRKQALGGAVRLNLGCGEKPLPDYINCDGRLLADVLVIADVRALPFEDGTVDEIASAHLVEHFRQHHLETVILPYWKKLLKPGGTLRVICPNWEAMIQRLNRGDMSMADFKQVTFGGQDYQGDDHFSMYTPQSLGELLERAGFRDPTVVAEERMNGLCPEMEVTATAG